MQSLLANRAAALGRWTPSQRQSLAGKRVSGARSNGYVCKAFFGKIAKSIKDIGGGGAGSLEEDELYWKPQSRNCYTVEEAKDYYTITGIYAVQGDYELFEKMVASGKDPVDLVLLMACSEGDDGKVEECLAAGAHPDVVDHEGRSALEIATKDEIKELLQAALAKRS